MATHRTKSVAAKPDMTICTNPATGETIAKFGIDSVGHLREAVKKAKEAQPAWGALPVQARVRRIRPIITYIMEHLDDLARTISTDNGKTRVDAMGTEVLCSLMAVSYYCRQAPRFLADRPLHGGNLLFFNKKSRIARSPFGVVGIISPWNYPFSIPFSEIIMALLAGNAVILKTATETIATGFALKQCIEAADLPEHIFTFVNMPGSVAGVAFLESGIEKLFFTVSVPIGKYLMKKASETLTPVSLELGGNDPMIVCDDADISRAASGAMWAGFQNAGQSCGGIERIYVQRGVYDGFLRILKQEIESTRVGRDTAFDTDIGAMTTRRQMDTVKSHIDEAVKKGAKVFAQSSCPSDGKGQFMPCVVLTDCTHEMTVMREETFGPVVGVMPFDTIDEAVRLANDSQLGLTASVWSKNHRKALSIGRRIRAGAITINDHLMSHGLAETPWGGFRESGIGRTHGDIGFAEMTQPQVLVNDIMPFVKKNFWWHPSGQKVYNGIKGAAMFLYAGSFLMKMKGLYAVCKVFPRTFTANSR
jgi:succinate-semialdehyde dehydrogenase/glutarate-semialdehyde dehydrogenase